MGKNIGESIRKNLNSKYTQKLLYHIKHPVTDVFKRASQRATELNTEATGDLIGDKIADKIRKVSNCKLQMSMTKKCLKKDIYFQKKDRKLLMIWDQYNTIIMEYQNIIKVLYNTANQPSKFRMKNWDKIIGDAHGMYNANNQIKSKS